MALTNEDLKAILGSLQPIHNRLDGIDGRLDRMENRLDKVESEVSALKSGQIEIRKELKEMNGKVSETYQIALDAWGASRENRNWLDKIG